MQFSKKSRIIRLDLKIKHYIQEIHLMYGEKERMKING